MIALPTVGLENFRSETKYLVLAISSSKYLQSAIYILFYKYPGPTTSCRFQCYYMYLSMLSYPTFYKSGVIIANSDYCRHLGICLYYTWLCNDFSEFSSRGISTWQPPPQPSVLIPILIRTKQVYVHTYLMSAVSGTFRALTHAFPTPDTYM